MARLSGSRKMLGPGTLAPAFELSDTTGNHTELRAILEQGPALLAFFKVNCPVCQLSAPFLDRLASSGTVRVVGISQDDAGSTEGFNRRFGVKFPVLLDEFRAGYPVSNGFGISTVPSLFLIEPDGTISTAFTGFSKRDFETLGVRMGVQPFRPDEKVPEFRGG